MSKTNGPGGILSTVLKKCAPEPAPVLAKLFQISFVTRTVPSEWKTAHVIDVPKKGSKHYPSNYRPISLLPIIYKVTERIICDQISGHLGKHYLLCDSRYGFQEKRLTHDMFSYIIQSWNNALDTKKEN